MYAEPCSGRIAADESAARGTLATHGPSPPSCWTPCKGDAHFLLQIDSLFTQYAYLIVFDTYLCVFHPTRQIHKIRIKYADDTHRHVSPRNTLIKYSTNTHHTHTRMRRRGKHYKLPSLEGKRPSSEACAFQSAHVAKLGNQVVVDHLYTIYTIYYIWCI